MFCLPRDIADSVIGISQFNSDVLTNSTITVFGLTIASVRITIKFSSLWSTHQSSTSLFISSLWLFFGKTTLGNFISDRWSLTGSQDLFLSFLFFWLEGSLLYICIWSTMASPHLIISFQKSQNHKEEDLLLPSKFNCKRRNHLLKKCPITIKELKII